MLTAAEVQQANEVMQILKPLETATREVCGDHHITVSKIIPIADYLNRTLSGMDCLTYIGENMKNSLLDELKRRFGKMEEVQKLATSTILDPRLLTLFIYLFY